MAALSFCPNLGGYPQNSYYPELPPLPEQATNTQTLPVYDHELLSYHESFIFPETYLNPFLDLDELFYSQSYTTNLVPNYFSSTTNSNIVSLESEPEEEVILDHCFPFPKRLKTSSKNPANENYLPEYFCPNIDIDVFDAGYPVLPEVVPGAAAIPEFEPPAVVEFAAGRGNEGAKKQGGSVSLSAQSVAARERRRKITEKTQELGRLIPGGTKMNTAEMFQAASNYVKFLQAQSQLLQLMGKMEVPIPQDLSGLLASTTVQEKLYMQDKCLVARELLETLESDRELTRNMAEEIDQLLGFDQSSNFN